MKRIALSILAAFVLSGAAAAMEKQKLSDPQIAHIAYTAGQIDVDAGKQALEKSQDPTVRGFAQQMVRDHTAVNDKALALVKKLGVTPEANPTSKSLSEAAEKKHNELAKLSGHSFDRAYLENEIAYHKTVNGALHDTLIPEAKNAELKDLLQTGLKLFQEHQQHAEHLAKSVP